MLRGIRNRKFSFSYLVKGKKKKSFKTFYAPKIKKGSSPTSIEISLPFSTGKDWDETIINAERNKTILIRTWQGLVEVHLPKQFHQLKEQKKQALSHALISWKFRWVFNNLRGLKKLSPKKGRRCFADLIISLEDFLTYEKKSAIPLLEVAVNGNKIGLYDLDIERASSFLETQPKKVTKKVKIRSKQRRGKIGNKSGIIRGKRRGFRVR